MMTILWLTGGCLLALAGAIAVWVVVAELIAGQRPRHGQFHR